MLEQLKERLRNTNTEGQAALATLTQELRDNEPATRRLYKAIERGIVKIEDVALQRLRV